jgi:hypothetical protein
MIMPKNAHQEAAQHQHSAMAHEHSGKAHEASKAAHQKSHGIEPADGKPTTELQLGVQKAPGSRN